VELGILSLGDLQRDQRTGRPHRPVDRMAEILGYAMLADQLGLDVFALGHAGADPAKARAVYPYYHEYLRPKRPGGRGFVVSPAAFEAGTGRHGAIMIGSVGEITDELLDAAKTLDLDRIFAQVDWGGLPQDLVGESIARYATEIAPALRP
jgi:hypothetical protein